ncbi:hypothetical protein VTN96DRAFT_412 [Rasamsonia emersonii]
MTKYLIDRGPPLNKPNNYVDAIFNDLPRLVYVHMFGAPRLGMPDDDDDAVGLDDLIACRTIFTETSSAHAR